MIGGIVGGIIGGVVAVNVVIYSGIEPGYQASFPEVFRQNAFVGLVTVIILTGGPVAGVLVARWLRRRG